MPRYTYKQGRHLTYIYYYTKLYGRPPAESEIQQYFKVSPPSQHQMILTLEKNGLVTRVPGVPRSIRLSLTRTELIELLSSLLLETGEDGMTKKSVAK
ncbi:MAG: MarR family transcriptional regulator [Syntrophorhabdales bacterium]|jgi:repressor LexA